MRSTQKSGAFRRMLTAGVIVAVGVVGLAACGGDPTEGEEAAADTIVVGSAAFPENEILAEIYSQALEAKGIKSETKLSIGSREAYLPALENGEIDLLPEYTGNLLLYLDPEATATSPEDVEAALADVLPDGTELLEVSSAEDKDSLNVTQEYATANNLTTIADLANVGGFTLGANPEFADRPYGIPGLESVYGLTDIEFKAINDGGGPLTVKALLDGDVDVADIYSTTPSILENNLVTLEDPENLFAAQNVAPLINSDKATDEVKEILDEVSSKLTTEGLLELNAANQGPDKVAPADAAKQWLEDNGLL